MKNQNFDFQSQRKHLFVLVEFFFKYLIVDFQDQNQICLALVHAKTSMAEPLSPLCTSGISLCTMKIWLENSHFTEGFKSSHIPPPSHKLNRF